MDSPGDGCDEKDRLMVEIIDRIEESCEHAAEQREDRMHRITPQLPAGVGDGPQVPNRVVHGDLRQRNPKEAGAVRRRIRERDRRRDEQRPSPCSTDHDISALILALIMITLIIMYFLIWEVENSAPRGDNGTDTSRHHVFIDSPSHW